MIVDPNIHKLRTEMDRLMRERGIRTLADIRNPEPVFTRIPDMPDDRPYFTGYDVGRLYGWDQYFEGILQIYAGWDLVYIRNSLKMLLERMQPNGFIPRTLPVVWWGMCHAQPFLAQQALLLLRAGDDLSWLYPEYFYNLKGYLMHWERQRDFRGAGLSVLDHAAHGGMDNHYERAGHFHDAFCEGVDLNSFLIREYEAFALLSEHVDNHTEAEQFRGLARKKREALNRWCWDEQDGCYYDYHSRELRSIRVKHAGLFASLWAGVPDAGRAERLVKEHLLNPNEFWRPHPVPALAATEPGYDDGYIETDKLSCCSCRAHVWLPNNYFTFHGLLQYGYAAVAKELAEKTESLFLKAPFREYYQAEDGCPRGRNPFWGWSSLALYMREEATSGFDPTGLVSQPYEKRKDTV